VDELVQHAKNLPFKAESVRAYAEKYFSSERMASDYISLYSEILDSRTADQAEPIVA
jgi:hypothetical protein